MRLPRDRHGRVFLALLGGGALLLVGVLLVLLLSSGEEKKARPTTSTTTTTESTTTAPATTAPPPPPTTTAPPPPPQARSRRWPWAPSPRRSSGRDASPPARVGYGLADLGPTMWARLTGRRATITGLHYSTPYRVWAGDATFDFSDRRAARLAGRLDRRRRDPARRTALLPAHRAGAVSDLVSERARCRNHAVRRERLRRDRRPDRRSRRQGLLADRGGGGRERAGPA